MPAPDSAPLVELRDVTKAYAEGDTVREVLSGVRLSLRRGEFVVLLGRSGSGKSTLLNLISGIDLPSQGEVRVDGRDLGRLSERERTLLRRERIGFIFQAFNLLPTLTVEENVRLPLELNGHGATEAGARARALLEQVGLGTRARSFPDRLSGGEQQRVAVARALANQPSILLADEPTGNLDSKTGVEIMALFEQLYEAGHTLIVVTHEEPIARHARRIVRLRDGLIESDETLP